ncbi:MAG: GNAT family N-acetyltransferase [Rhodobacterales bacterium]
MTRRPAARGDAGRVAARRAGASSETPVGIALHRATGFATIACLPGVGTKFGRWMDVMLMQKILAAGSDLR